jgi:acetyltransferase
LQKVAMPHTQTHRHQPQAGLEDPAIRAAKLPEGAKRPYPTQYVWERKLKDGSIATIRPIRPEDEGLMMEFHKTLSDMSVHYRYFGMLKLDERIAHERLRMICGCDYDREMALVIDRKIADGSHHIVGIGRLSRVPEEGAADFAVVISDAWQRHGLGSDLLKKLIYIAEAEGVGRIIGCVMCGNVGMQKICRKAGFQLHRLPDGDYQADMLMPKTLAEIEHRARNSGI